MRFITPTRCDWASTYKNGYYKADVFYSRNVFALSFVFVNDLHMYQMDVKEDALPGIQRRQKLELVIAA